MNFTFQINYHTQWGESLGVILHDNENEIFMLSTQDGEHWEGTFELRTMKYPFIYRYGIFCHGKCIRREIGRYPHMLCVHPNKQTIKTCVFRDAWRDLPQAAYLFSAALSGSEEEYVDKAVMIPGRSFTFRALSPCLHKERRKLFVVGSCEKLGNWQPSMALPMVEVQPNVWSAIVKETSLATHTEYKYIAINEQGEVEWESGENRTIDRCLTDNQTCLILPETEVYFSSSHRKMAGTAVPVFALRSERSFGVGDFTDLKMLIDWAVATHQQAIQILPINDTTINGTWTDSYPYNSISIYAFHPMYLDINRLGKLKGVRINNNFERKRLELNSLPQIDYEAVNNAKRHYARLIFDQCGKSVLRSEGFKQFFADNAHWLQPYAAFSVLRDYYGTPDFRTWHTHSTYNEELIQEFCDPCGEEYGEVSYYYYIQYNLHIQLLDASRYARERGVMLKGDIPIGISRNSVEAWVEPYYFNMNGQAGAPPDDFSKNGQNWGFPTYNWDVMEKDGYQWWIRRFTKMAEYFTAYRIDHILGFFRIWEIPQHSVHGLLGQFSPALPMSVAEIEQYGLKFQKDFMTRPFINEELLSNLFGTAVEMVKATFITHLHHDIYAMREEFDTQRKVEAWFAAQGNAAPDAEVREKLYALISNVLFVPDRTDANKYHPRISAQDDYLYTRLTPQEQQAFMQLYNDYFYHRHNAFWYQEAMKKLPKLIGATPMLVCGEDLGMVPACVPWVMEQLQILSLEVQRMPKRVEEQFGVIDNYPYLSVCTISSHDTSTLRGWWQEDYALTQQYASKVLGLLGEVNHEAPGWICREIIYRHLKSRSLLCILTLQDWLSMDEELRNPDVEGERINVPANPRHYWRYRMHLTLEALLDAANLNKEIAAFIDETGRY